MVLTEDASGGILTGSKDGKGGKRGSERGKRENVFIKRPV